MTQEQFEAKKQAFRKYARRVFRSSWGARVPWRRAITDLRDYGRRWKLWSFRCSDEVFRLLRKRFLKLFPYAKVIEANWYGHYKSLVAWENKDDFARSR